MKDSQNEHVYEATLASDDLPVTKPNQKLFESKWMVLGILFCVTGFLGIPLLWRNPKFSHVERIVWSVIVSLYTLALIFGAFEVCMWSYRRIMGS